MSIGLAIPAIVPEGSSCTRPHPRCPSPSTGSPRATTAFVRACRVIPGGVNSPARAFGAVGGEPPFMARAEGQYLYDIDGHQYIDYIGSWGPMILGHAHPAVEAAVAEALERGSSFGAPTVREVEIAEAVVAAVPSIEKVRFVSSGTEAAMSAVRVARGVTGRNKIVKMTGPLPRPRRRPARPGGLGGDDARHAQQPRRDPGRGAGHDPLPVQRRRGRRRRLRPVPRPDRRGPAGARRRQHGAGPARGRATWSCSAS